MNNRKTLILSSAIVAGLLTSMVALRMDTATDVPAGISVAMPGTVFRAPTAEYGEYIIRNTPEALGSSQSESEHRYSGNHLDCSSCHLESGRKPGTLNLLEASSRYPRFSGRDGKDGDLFDRIDGCMQRSMSGRTLPRDSIEMKAMVTYIQELGRQYAAMSEIARTPDEPPEFVEPDRRADVASGEQVYQARCQICHGENGEGLKESADISDGYLFPPLWGDDTYNIGAGMARNLTAARFIKARMPLGEPTLTDDQAYDVAAYINSQERPGKADLELDYPELFRKPVDSPYGPYDDPFSQEQHRLGPFGPIREYYQNR